MHVYCPHHNPNNIPTNSQTHSKELPMQSRLITSQSSSIDVAASTRRSQDYPSFLLAKSLALPAHWPNLEAYPETASSIFEVPVAGLPKLSSSPEIHSLILLRPDLRPLSAASTASRLA